MKSKKALEGYLQIDGRDTPGLPEAVAEYGGLTVTQSKQNFECAVLTCSHCQAGVMLNPLRQRERNYCSGCDKYICDNCAAIKAANGGLCKTFEEVIEEVIEAAVKKESGLIIIP